MKTYGVEKSETGLGRNPGVSATHHCSPHPSLPPSTLIALTPHCPHPLPLLTPHPCNAYQNEEQLDRQKWVSKGHCEALVFSWVDGYESQHFVCFVFDTLLLF